MTSTPSSTGSRPILTPVLLILLALLSSFTPLSIDMYLPALPVIVVCPLPRYQPVSQSPAALASPWADRSGA